MMTRQATLRWVVMALLSVFPGAAFGAGATTVSEQHGIAASYNQPAVTHFTMVPIAVAITSNSGCAGPAATFLPVSLAPAGELGLSVRPSPAYRGLNDFVLPKENCLNPCLSPQGSTLALRTREEQQACYRGCVNRCWLRWMSSGHAGDRFQRYQLYLKCKNSCVWSCG